MNDAGDGETFADYIRRGRQRKNWTQGDLAEATGVSKSTLSRWESDHLDRAPTPQHVRTVCAVLGLDPRRAVVLLGYITTDEIDSTRPHLPEDIETILDILQHPALPASERADLLNYLKVRLDVLRRTATG